MKHTGATAAAIAVTTLIAGCGNGSSSSPHSTDWVATWNAQAMNNTSTANTNKYKTIAKKMCKDLRDGKMTATDLATMPLSKFNNDSGMNPAQMGLFELAAVKQYCPEQASKLPFGTDTP